MGNGMRVAAALKERRTRSIIQGETAYEKELRLKKEQDDKDKFRREILAGEKAKDSWGVQRCKEVAMSAKDLGFAGFEFRFKIDPERGDEPYAFVDIYVNLRDEIVAYKMSCWESYNARPRNLRGECGTVDEAVAECKHRFDKWKNV